MSEIYIVFEEEGEWSDYTIKAIAAYSNKDFADELAAERTAEFAARQEAYRQWKIAEHKVMLTMNPVLVQSHVLWEGMPRIHHDSGISEKAHAIVEKERGPCPYVWTDLRWTVNYIPLNIVGEYHVGKKCRDE